MDGLVNLAVSLAVGLGIVTVVRVLCGLNPGGSVSLPWIERMREGRTYRPETPNEELTETQIRQMSEAEKRRRGLINY